MRFLCLLLSIEEVCGVNGVFLDPILVLQEVIEHSEHGVSTMYLHVEICGMTDSFAVFT